MWFLLVKLFQQTFRMCLRLLHMLPLFHQWSLTFLIIGFLIVTWISVWTSWFSVEILIFPDEFTIVFARIAAFCHCGIHIVAKSSKIIDSLAFSHSIISSTGFLLSSFFCSYYMLIKSDMYPVRASLFWKLQNIFSFLSNSFRFHEILPLLKKIGGGQFYPALGDLKFSLTSGGEVSQMEGLKFSILFFWGGRGQRTKSVKVCLLISS